MHKTLSTQSIASLTVRPGVVTLVMVAILYFCMGRLAQGAEPPAAVPSPTGAAWVQTFSADFTSPTASLKGWTIEHGTGSQYGLTGWGNNEAETYTDDPSNLNISDGALNLVAIV